MVGLIFLVLGCLTTVLSAVQGYIATPDKDSRRQRVRFWLLLIACSTMILGVWKSAQDLREAAVQGEHDEEGREQLRMILDTVRNLGKAARDPETAKQFEGIATRLEPLADETNKLKITFLTPLDGGIVDPFDTVRYTVAGKVPAGYTPILVVRDPLGQLWSWGSSSSHTHGVQFGVAGDSGQQFEVGVTVTDEDFPLNSPRRDLPRNVLYESISVRRR